MLTESIYTPDVEVQKMLNLAQYVVEANSFERFACYLLYSNESAVPYHKKISFKQGTSGYGPQIGMVDNRPICISIIINYINNVPVLFFEGTSMLVDYKVIEDWLTIFCPAYANCYTCDMNNFHQCIYFTEKANKIVENIL